MFPVSNCYAILEQTFRTYVCQKERFKSIDENTQLAASAFHQTRSGSFSFRYRLIGGPLRGLLMFANAY